MNDEIFTRLEDLPTSVKGLTCPNPDGTYTVFLNARMSSDQQAATYRHEILHIRQNDFEQQSVQRIEAYGHRNP